MATEIQEQAPVGEQQLQQGGKAGERLQPSLEEQQNFQNNIKSPKSETKNGANGESKGTEKSSSGVLEIPSIFALANDVSDKNKPDQKDIKDVKDGQDGLSREAQEAKDKFVKALEERLKDDARFRDNPNLLKTVEATLDQMDKRVLNEHVKTSDGSKIDQQKQLAMAYDSLTRIATDAEKLTFNNSNEKVFNQPWMVNNILVGAIEKGADPEHNFNQGNNNTCATESINRQATALMIGENLRTIADTCTKGSFSAVDNADKTFTCSVNKESLRPDAEARSMYLGPSNARDAFGQIADIRTAQLHLDLVSRDGARTDGRAGGEGRYVYKEVSPTSQRDTGERVVDTYARPPSGNNKTIAENPCINAVFASNIKQALIGRFIDADFGKETTFASDRNFGSLANITTVENASQLATGLKSAHDKGWRLSYMATHVGNYVRETQGLGGAQGWHATSVQLSKNGDIDFFNNWGGEHNYKNLKAEQLFTWMNAPKDATLSDRRVGDHIFDPDPIYARDGRNPLSQEREKVGNNEPKFDKDKERLLAERRKELERALADAKAKEEQVKQLELVRSRMALIESHMTRLAKNDYARMS